MFYYHCMNGFSQRLRELRTDAGLSRTELAARLNVSARLISYWELGKRECSFEMLVTLADLFETSVDYLLGRIDY